MNSHNEPTLTSRENEYMCQQLRTLAISDNFGLILVVVLVRQHGQQRKLQQNLVGECITIPKQANVYFCLILFSSVAFYWT